MRGGDDCIRVDIRAKKHTGSDVYRQLDKAFSERRMQPLQFEGDKQVWEGLSVLLQAIAGGVDMESPSCTPARFVVHCRSA